MRTYISFEDVASRLYPELLQSCVIKKWHQSFFDSQRIPIDVHSYSMWETNLKQLESFYNAFESLPITNLNYNLDGQDATFSFGQNSDFSTRYIAIISPEIQPPEWKITAGFELDRIVAATRFDPRTKTAFAISDYLNRLRTFFPREKNKAEYEMLEDAMEKRNRFMHNCFKFKRGNLYGISLDKEKLHLDRNALERVDDWIKSYNVAVSVILKFLYKSGYGKNV